MIIDAATVADTEALHTLVNAAYRGHGGMAGWTSETEFMDGTRVDLPSLREQLREGQPAILLLRTEAGTAPIGCISSDSKQTPPGTSRCSRSRRATRTRDSDASC